MSSDTPLRRSPRKKVLFVAHLPAFTPKDEQDIPAVARYLCMPDVVCYTLDWCTWTDLVRLMHANTGLRWIIFFYIRLRIKSFFSGFFNASLFNSFFELLAETRGAVFGGIVRCIMANDQMVYRLALPNRIDIAVPISSAPLMPVFERWRCFLACIGYTAIDMEEPQDEFPSCKRWIILKNVRPFFPTYSYHDTYIGF